MPRCCIKNKVNKSVENVSTLASRNPISVGPEYYIAAAQKKT